MEINNTSLAKSKDQTSQPVIGFQTKVIFVISPYIQLPSFCQSSPRFYSSADACPVGNGLQS